MNAQYPLGHQVDDEFHRSSMNQFGFVAPQLGPYSMNSHFRDGAERHDYVVSHTSTGIPGRNFDSYSPPPHDSNASAEQHLNWTGGTHLNPHTLISSHNVSSFISYPSSHASQNLISYDFYDHPLSSSSPHEFLYGNSFPYTQDSIVIHPSRSAPPSCSTSPLVHDMAVDYLDIPLMQTSREHSPAKSDNDPSDAKRRFPCLLEGCARRFTSQYTLRVHMEAHKPKPKVTFPCTLGCSERFSRQHDRLRHEVSKHGKICEFSCDECGRFFSSKKTLGNHKCPVAHGTTRWMDSN